MQKLLTSRSMLPSVCLAPKLGIVLRTQRYLNPRDVSGAACTLQQDRISGSSTNRLLWLLFLTSGFLRLQQRLQYKARIVSPLLYPSVIDLPADQL